MLFRTAALAVALFAASTHAWGSGSCPDGCEDCYWAGQCYGQSGSCSAGVTDCGAGNAEDACINSWQPGPPGGMVMPDIGCEDPAKPVCVRGNGVHYDLPSDVAGQECAVCFNSLESDEACDFDDGCPPSKPDCALESGYYLPIWAPGDVCVANCHDNGDGEDPGCHEDYPNCVIGPDHESPGKGKKGDCCSVCTLESCDDGIQCTDDACDVDDGCSNTPVNSRCDDSLECTIDTCNIESGCDNTPDNSACDDGVDCTIDLCDPFGGDPSTGCSNTPDNSLCDDGNECTANICTATGCEYPALPPGDPCEDGACFEGECACVPVANTGCEPGDICLEPPTPGNPECVPCINDKIAMGGIDLGCDDTNPACVMDNGMQPLPDGVGARCAPCVNDDTFSDPDQGCDDKGSKKICVASSTKTSPASGVEGDICARCLNTDSGTGKDYGCNNNKKYCVFSDGEQPDSNEKGDKCSLCLNTKMDGTADPGCTDPDKPLCDADVGDGGNQCKECPPSPAEVSVCFAIDESGSISTSEFNQMKTFINAIITALSDPLTTTFSEFAASQFTSGFGTVFTLTDAADAIAEVNSNPKSSGNTNIAGGISQCVKLLDGTIGPAAQYSPKLLITVTDGNPTAGGSGGVSDEQAAANAANAAINAGFILIAVGIGGSVDTSVLQSIASSDDLVFEGDFDDAELEELKDEILAEVGCVE